jgi:Flp pilus assembly pilin Flp
MLMITNMRRHIADLYRDEEGASLVEYILLAVLIGVAAIAGMTFLGKTTNNRMNNIATAVG